MSSQKFYFGIKGYFELKAIERKLISEKLSAVPHLPKSRP